MLGYVSLMAALEAVGSKTGRKGSVSTFARCFASRLAADICLGSPVVYSHL